MISAYRGDGGRAFPVVRVGTCRLAARGRGYLWRSLPLWFGWVAFIVLALQSAIIFYYQTYHNHIDVFAFGLVDDDTCAVLANMWRDYPVIKGVSPLPCWHFLLSGFSYRVRSHDAAALAECPVLGGVGSFGHPDRRCRTG